MGQGFKIRSINFEHGILHSIGEEPLLYPSTAFCGTLCIVDDMPFQD